MSRLISEAPTGVSRVVQRYPAQRAVIPVLGRRDLNYQSGGLVPRYRSAIIDFQAGCGVLIFSSGAHPAWVMSR